MEQIEDAASAFPSSVKYPSQPATVDKIRQDQTTYNMR